MKTGIEIIAAERHRQESKEGWSPGHDDLHEYGEIQKAAESYLWELRAREASVSGTPVNFPPKMWPWGESDWKPTRDRIRQLAKAGALIAAEIDRLQRAQ